MLAEPEGGARAPIRLRRVGVVFLPSLTVSVSRVSVGFQLFRDTRKREDHRSILKGFRSRHRLAQHVYRLFNEALRFQ